MAVEVRQNGEESGVADSHAAFARLADASAKLFAEQAAAVAAMTAFSISVAGQMTGLMLGTLKPDEDRPADALAQRRPMDVAQTDGNVVHLPTRIESSDSAAPAGSQAAESVRITPKAVAGKNKSEPAKKAARTAKAAPHKAAAPVVAAEGAPQSTPTAGSADDLKRISGIGPRLEKVLNGRGISSYAAIAGLNAAAIKKIDDELGLEGRVIRDDWTGQARALAAGRPDATR